MMATDINNDEYANEISIKQRNLVIELFSKNKIQKQWEDFLNEIWATRFYYALGCRS